MGLAPTRLAMPEPTTPEAQAADAASTSPAQEGVTPPETPQALTVAQADALLSGADDRPERDPLDGPMDRDPLDDMSDSDPLAALDSPAEQQQEEVAEEPVAETAEPDPEAEAPTEEAAEEAAELKTEADGRKRTNILRKKDGKYVYSDAERAIMLLADEEGISLAQASQRLGIKLEAAPAAEAEVQPEPVKTTAQIDAEIAALKAERAEAKSRFDDDAKDAATEKIEELILQRQNAREREVEQTVQQRTSQAKFDQGVTESLARVTEAYPDATTEGTDLNLAVQAETDRQFRETPETFKKNPKWPLAIVAQVALEMGIAPKAKAPVAKPAATVAPKVALKPAAPTKRATPIPSPGSVTAPTQSNPLADLSKQLADAQAKNSLKEIESVTAKIFALTESFRPERAA